MRHHFVATVSILRQRAGGRRFTNLADEDTRSDAHQADSNAFSRRGDARTFRMHTGSRVRGALAARACGAAIVGAANDCECGFFRDRMHRRCSKSGRECILGSGDVGPQQRTRAVARGECADASADRLDAIRCGVSGHHSSPARGAVKRIGSTAVIVCSMMC